MTDIDVMEAGAEMDRLVAEEVMKWTRYQDGVDPETYNGPIYAWRSATCPRVAWATAWYDNPAWSPSKNIADAWAVVDQLRKEGVGITLMLPGGYTDEGLGPVRDYSASMRSHRPEGGVRAYGRDAYSVEVAICRAAVKHAEYLATLLGHREIPAETPVEIPEKPPGNPFPGLSPRAV